MSQAYRDGYMDGWRDAKHGYDASELALDFLADRDEYSRNYSSGYNQGIQMFLAAKDLLAKLEVL